MLTLFNLSVCLSVCLLCTVYVKHSCFFLITRAVRGRFSQTRSLWKRASMGYAWDVFPCTPSRGGRGRRAAVDFVVCFECGNIYMHFFVFFFLNAHGLLQV